jgi:hypothetical protein
MIAPIHFATSWSWFLVAVACTLGCAGRSEETLPGSGGASSSAGRGGSGTGGSSAGRGSSEAAGASGANGASGGTAGAPDYSALPTCLQPAASEPCNAYFERFAFNGATLGCEPFVYGGCGSNGNNFETAAACEATCASQYSDCDPISRGEGCPCDDARDCAFGSCSNAIYELTMDGHPDCPPSPIGVCTRGGAESCTCPIAGGDAFCRP